MAFDPSIILGYKGVEIPNQLAQYAQMAQVENAQQQNALAQFQLGAARRAEQGQTALGQAYGEFYGGGAGGAGMGGVPGAAPGEISYDAMSNSIVNKLSKTAPHLIPGELAKIAEMKQKALLTKETQGKIDAQAAAQIDKSLSVFRQAVPAINDADSAVRYIKAQYADPVLGKVAVRFKPLEQTIEETIQRFSTPEGIRQWKIENAGITGDKLIDMMRQTTQTTDLGGQVRERKMDYFGNPVGEPTFTQKTPTVGDVTGQQRLAFDKAKFAWEKANPNKTIHEDANGLLAIDNRTGVATPVVYGSTGIQPAPIAAPGASMMRQPPPAASTNQRIPAIPGMTSVLDQVAVPNSAMPLPAEGGMRVPGAPVGGKERNLPEHFVKTDMQLANLAGSVNAFKTEVAKNKNTGAKWLPTGEDTANMEAKYISLLMGVKDLYTLGALTGPDLSLIEAQITNPSSWSGKFTTRAGFNAQIKVIEDMVQRGATNLENTYGRVPKGTKKALESLPIGSGISGATPNNPLGLTIPGGR
jgi:hypothetical protein